MAKEAPMFSRRDLLKLAGMSAAVSTGLLAGCAALAPNRAGLGTDARAIDIHHHYIPPELIEEVKKNGKALAARVLEHAIRDLKMSGVTIASNVVGKYYNSTDFDPFWKKVQELDVLMIMHPEWVAGADKMAPYSLRSICGNPADTTLSVTYMMYTGVFDRFPNLKLALLHGGGYFPYHLGRLDQGLTSASGSSVIPAKQPPSKYLKNLYFDNLVYRVETLEYLMRMVGAEHVMVGTDYPFDLGDWRAAEKIQAMNCTESERTAMLYGNAKKLLRL
jgi:aminocarboxymuconate-semialdehyde decarboxylase